MFKKYIFSILFNTNEKTKISISIRRIQTNPNNLFFRDIHLDNSIYRKTDVSVSGRKVKNRSVSHQWHRCRSRNSFLWFIRDRSGACFGRRRILEGCAETVRKAPYCWICAHGDRLKYLCRRFLAACKLRAVPPIVSIRTPELRRRRIIPAPLCRIFVSSASTYGASIREFVTTSEATCIADEALFRSPFMLMQMHAILFGSSTSFERRIRSIKTCQMLLL